jgi:hypothetical protein
MKIMDGFNKFNFVAGEVISQKAVTHFPPPFLVQTILGAIN